MQNQAHIQFSKRIAFLSLLIVFATVGETAQAAAVTRGPYLQMGTPNSIVVRWRTDVSTDGRVRYGTTLGSLNNFADGTVGLDHEITLTSLSADTLYYYSVGTTAATLAGGDTNHFFVTIPPASTAAPTRVWILGDSGTANSSA